MGNGAQDMLLDVTFSSVVILKLRPFVSRQIRLRSYSSGIRSLPIWRVCGRGSPLLEHGLDLGAGQESDLLPTHTCWLPHSKEIISTGRRGLLNSLPLTCAIVGGVGTGT